MPVSHIGLSVSHLPTSTSFFLSALQPLGYRYCGQWGPQIGLGVLEADFFLTQEIPGIQAGGSHVAFTASSRAAVREFFASALQAGARSHGSPASRYNGEDCFNAAVLDFDGNSIEVIFHEDDVDDGCSVGGHSRVLTWREDVVDNLGEAKEVMSENGIRSAAASAAQKAIGPGSINGSTAAKSTTPSELSAKSVLATLQRSLVGSDSGKLLFGDSKIEISTKALAGTLLGAAAGAAVAYAMCKGEEDSARAEQEAYIASRRQSRVLELPAPLMPPTPQSAHQAGSNYSSKSKRSTLRAIEAPPHHLPSRLSVANRTSSHQSYPIMKSIEYVPIASHSHASVTRSARTPAPSYHELSNELDRKSTHSRSHRTRSQTGSHAHAQTEVGRTSKRSSTRHSSTSKSRPKSEAPSKARSAFNHLDRVLEERATSEHQCTPPPDHTEYVAEYDDLETVAPSDSISCAGSSKSKRSRRSKHEKLDRRGESSHSALGAPRRSEKRGSSKLKPDSISEAESEITMTPRRYKERSMVSLPIRGFTPSMLRGDGRTAASWYG